MSTEKQSNTKAVVAKAGSQKLPDLISQKEVENKFISLYTNMHGQKDGNRFYEVEKFHFLKQISENKYLAECDNVSLYGCFMDAAVNGLSFDPAMKHQYLIPKSKNMGTKQSPLWKKVATLTISGIGELILRQRSGQILHADNPVLVYEGDTFKFGTRNGSFFVEHEVSLPRKSDKAVACYLKIVRNDNTLDYKVLTREELEAFRKKSDSPDSSAWKDSYNGMFMAKTIKHAFKTYPKLRAVGMNSQLETEKVDEVTIPEDTYTMPTAIEETPIQEAEVIPDEPGMAVWQGGPGPAPAQEDNGGTF
jgi:phage RecT family recombinase